MPLCGPVEQSEDDSTAAWSRLDPKEVCLSWKPTLTEMLFFTEVWLWSRKNKCDLLVTFSETSFCYLQMREG